MKNAIRKEALGKRNQIPKELKGTKDSSIKQRLLALPEFLSARSVLFYASFRSEVETSGIIRESLSMGKRAILPKVDKRRHILRLYEIKNLDEMVAGFMGIPEPFQSEEREVLLEDIDLVIIPGAGYDYSGNRLGYGGGYYDILLSGKKKNMPIIALAYEEQLVDAIPAEKHDVRVDMIVTDQRVIRV
ncbi:MAG: 5-formyltetrahydrofolate cyclo-ligase [Thermodesulfovibrionales bacterium]|jgi:5-formyltetrahydrofolate cyclo-ligase